MVKKYYLIHLLLILIIVFLMQKNYEEWTSSLPAWKETAGSKQKKNVAVLPSPAREKAIQNPAAYRPVSDKNIFSPDRKEFPVLLVNPQAGRPPARPVVELYGVGVGPEFHSALVSNLTRRADRGDRETISVKLGDRVGEYKVAAIREDRITLESSADSFDVLLYDPAKPKKRPAVVSTKTPTPPTPIPPAVSKTPPRPYTPPAAARSPVTTPPPGVVNPSALPGRIRGGTIRRPQIPPARTRPVPDTDDEEDNDED